MKIGFFDSGRGGLLVAEAVRDSLPQYDYLYYGDTAHVPYGDRSESEIYDLTRQGVEYLFEADCLIVILACNTASAETLRKLQDEWLPTQYPDRRILGVIIPTVESVVEASCAQVLLLATARTVSAGKYHLELGKRNEINTKITAHATPTLVPLIEVGKISDAVTQATNIILGYQNRGENINGVILGCTHYGLLVGELRQRFPDVRFFTQTELIPTKLKQYLTAHPELENRLTKVKTFATFFTGKEYTEGER